MGLIIIIITIVSLVILYLTIKNKTADSRIRGIIAIIVFCTSLSSAIYYFFPYDLRIDNHDFNISAEIYGEIFEISQENKVENLMNTLNEIKVQRNLILKLPNYISFNIRETMVISLYSKEAPENFKVYLFSTSKEGFIEKNGKRYKIINAGYITEKINKLNLKE